jgi:hypothetical protein
MLMPIFGVSVIGTLTMSRPRRVTSTPAALMLKAGSPKIPSPKTTPPLQSIVTLFEIVNGPGVNVGSAQEIVPPGKTAMSADVSVWHGAVLGQPAF